jgi:hypothetical protein
LDFVVVAHFAIRGLIDYEGKKKEKGREDFHGLMWQWPRATATAVQTRASKEIARRHNPGRLVAARNTQRLRKLKGQWLGRRRETANLGTSR